MIKSHEKLKPSFKFACDYFLVNFRLINSQKRFSLVSTFFISLLLSFVNLITNLNHFFVCLLKNIKFAHNFLPILLHFVWMHCMMMLLNVLNQKFFSIFFWNIMNTFFIEIDYEFLSLLFFNLLRFYAITWVIYLNLRENKLISVHRKGLNIIILGRVCVSVDGTIRRLLNWVDGFPFLWKQISYILSRIFNVFLFFCVFWKDE